MRRYRETEARRVERENYELRKAVLGAASEVAREDGAPIVRIFDDSLRGDTARLRVYRKTRKKHDPLKLWDAIEENLTP